MLWKGYASTALAILWLSMGDSAAKAACSRLPDYRTEIPAGSSRELTGQDPGGRDFQFYSRSIALIIGESNYVGWNPLKSVSEEMKRLRAALEANKFEVFQFNDLKSDELRDAVRCFLSQEVDRTEMRVLVFFAGHGATRNVFGGNVGYVVPVDAPKAAKQDDLDGPAFREAAVPLSQFVQWAEETEAKHALFIFDSCFSGAILDARGETREKERPSNYVFSDTVQKPLREFIASGSGDQTVPEPSTFLDLFVRALLGEAPEADANHDGYVTGSELIVYLKGWVPRYVPQQTPVSGRILDSRFDQGDFVFMLPPSGKREAVARTVSTRPMEYRVVFRGAASSAAKQVYEVESLLTTRAVDCTAGCATSAPQYDLSVRVPLHFAEGTALDEVELRCVGGGCDGFSLVEGPSLAEDRRSASVRLRAWGSPSTWRLTATLLLKGSGAATPVFDTLTQTVASVDPGAVVKTAVVDPVDPARDPNVKVILSALESDDPTTRRSARTRLTTVLALSRPEDVTALIRLVPTGSYRYQLGLMTALAELQGWSVSDPLAIDVVASLARARGGEPTLRAAAAKALGKARLFAFYEVGPDGWLTKSGQLKPLGRQQPPLPEPTKLARDAILQAESAVYLRSGPQADSPVVAVLKARDCVRVVAPPRQANPPGWIQVAQSVCGQG